MNINQRFGQIIMRAWADEEFRRKLLEHPGETFAEFGIQAPPGVTIKVVADDAQTQHFVLPLPPAPVLQLELDA